MNRYSKKLVDSLKSNKTLAVFDGLLYIVGSIPMFIVTLILLVLNAVIYMGKGMTKIALLQNYLRYIIPTFLLPILTGIIIMKLDKKPIKPMIKGIICYPIFLGSWLLINFKCLFKRETNWEKIEHVRDIKINELI